MPETHQDILEVLRTFAAGSRAIVESVHSSPQMGVVSSFKFGMGYGALLMGLAAAGIPFDRVSPAKWRRFIGLAKGEASDRGFARIADKNLSKERAQQLFPGVKITHMISEALLLAEYGRRVSLGMASESRVEERPHQVKPRSGIVGPPSLFGDQP